MNARRVGKSVCLVACRCATAAAARRPAIVLYHSIGEPGGVPSSLFARQLAYLRQRFRVVALSDLAAGLRAGGAGSGKPMAAITFDDGNRDNAEVALPMLAAAGIPATFFLLPPRLRTGGIDPFGHPAMDLAQAQELVAAGHEVGAHTLSHTRLTRLPEAEARHEIAGSRAELEGALGVEIRSFAYPKGDHNSAVRSLVAECGYRAAVTVREGLVQAGSDVLALPRISGRPTESMLAFGCKAHPGIDLYERLVGRA